MAFRKAGKSAPEAIALGRLFSAAVIKELGQKSNPILLKRIAQEANASKILPPFNSIADLFEQAYSFLSEKFNRHEYIYKNILARRVLLGKHSLNTASMLTEFRVGSSKADVVILNGTSTVYEIKSERDSLARLYTQLSSYQNVFDRVYVIAGKNHIEELEKSIPIEIGILCFNRHRDLFVTEHRKAHSNIDRLSPHVIFESLQRNEYLKILRNHGFTFDGIPNTRIHSEAKRCFSSLT